MKLGLISITLLTLAITYADVKYSIDMANQVGKPETTIIYTFKLKHKDGTDLTLNLVKFKDQCRFIGLQYACYGGFHEHKSDFTRKYDPEHPVDTTETISMAYTMKGKIPVLSMEDLYHEILHANIYHYMSRPVCETNYRYPECQESLSYGYTQLLSEVRKLEKQKKIILKNDL